MIFEEKNFVNKKKEFHIYIDCIKKKSKSDLYSIINPTLVKNSNLSNFPRNFITRKVNNDNKFILFLKNTIKFYIKNIYFLIVYFLSFLIFKIFHKKSRSYNLETIIDVFGLVDKTNQSGKFNENYFKGAYEVLEKFNIKYSILLRPYGVDNNPFKLINFLKIISKDKRDFIFEYEFLNAFDFFKIFWILIKYPLSVLNLRQIEKNENDEIFNYSLFEDINYFSFNSITRFILGKNLSKINSIKKVYSWYEFQVIERSFNYAIKKNCNHIKISGFFITLNNQTLYSFADDIDHSMMTTPHKILINSKYHKLNRGKKVNYGMGVSLRYQNIFNFKGTKEENDILVLGSYSIQDTKYVINNLKKFDKVLFKNHPAIPIEQFKDLPKNVSVTDQNIQKLFESTKIVIGTSSSGSNLEAVACGLSVIIVPSQHNYTENPLVDKGLGKIWDIATNEEEIYKVYKELSEYRNKNQTEIVEIAKWYKLNFFIEPTENNILRAFDIIS